MGGREERDLSIFCKNILMIEKKSQGVNVLIFCRGEKISF